MAGSRVRIFNLAAHRFFFANPMVGSWADGATVLIGEDSIDFDIHLTGIDRTRGVATLLVKHVPPKAPKIRIPAEWMRESVTGAPNNWVQVRRSAGTYIGAVGKETFDVELTIRLSTGEILSATMDNLVESVARECADVRLSDCSQPRPSPTVRKHRDVADQLRTIGTIKSGWSFSRLDDQGWSQVGDFQMIPE